MTSPWADSFGSFILRYREALEEQKDIFTYGLVAIEVFQSAGLRPPDRMNFRFWVWEGAGRRVMIQFDQKGLYFDYGAPAFQVIDRFFTTEQDLLEMAKLIKDRLEGK